MEKKKIFVIAGVSLVGLTVAYYAAKASVIHKIAELRTPDGTKVIYGGRGPDGGDLIVSVEDERASNRKYMWEQGDSLFALLRRLKGEKWSSPRAANNS